jgi:hypothetical protein
VFLLPFKKKVYSSSINQKKQNSILTEVLQFLAIRRLAHLFMILSIENLDVAKLRKKFSEFFGIGVEKNFFFGVGVGFRSQKM